MKEGAASVREVTDTVDLQEPVKILESLVGGSEERVLVPPVCGGLCGLCGAGSGSDGS